MKEIDRFLKLLEDQITQVPISKRKNWQNVQEALESLSKEEWKAMQSAMMLFSLSRGSVK